MGRLSLQDLRDLTNSIEEFMKCAEDSGYSDREIERFLENELQKYNSGDPDESK